jgi:putative FmdB family regulatory protein
VATYEYQCDDHGLFEVTRALGTSPESLACPVCESKAGRVFSKPMLSFSNPALVAAIEHSERSRDEPEVVTSLPRRPAHERTPVLPLTPTLRRLPRP